MAIIDDLLASLSTDAPVRSVLVGAHLTVVCSRRCGLSSTLAGPRPHGLSGVRDVGSLHHKSARQLAEYARSDDWLDVSIGVAAINSLIELDERQFEETNAAAVLAERGRGRRVALVGHFPFVPRLRDSVGQLWVIERRPVDGDHPAEAAAALIPQADIVAVTGSALVNHTLDGLLQLRRPGAEVFVIGPSTPLSAVLFGHGATELFGALVVDEALVQLRAGQGASFRQVQGVRAVRWRPGA